MNLVSALPRLGSFSDEADSPRMPLIVGGGAAILLAVLLLIWAGTMSVAGGAIASGRVTIEGNRKAVQHRDGGTVKTILVREGQHVEKGQPLFELNPTDLQADVAVLTSSRASTMVKLARLRAEARNDGAITWPSEVLAMREDDQVRAMIDQETALFEARLLAYRGNIALLQQQIEGRQRQIEGFEGRLVTIREQLTSIIQERQSLLPLLEKGLVARPRVLALERTAASLRGEIETIQAQIAAERSGIQQAQTQIEQLHKDRHEAVAKEIAEADAQLAEVVPRLTSARERLERSVLVAPESGYVYGLAVFNPGAVITPGQTVLEIVPASEPLVLSVEISPSDIERVQPGQQVTVHLLAYSQRYQSVIRGQLEKVSADRFDDRTQKDRSFYSGIVRVGADELKKANVELLPGMPVQVVIETGERTILSYLLDPVFRITDFAFRER